MTATDSVDPAAVYAVEGGDVAARLTAVSADGIRASQSLNVTPPKGDTVMRCLLRAVEPDNRGEVRLGGYVLHGEPLAMLDADGEPLGDALVLGYSWAESEELDFPGSGRWIAEPLRLLRIHLNDLAGVLGVSKTEHHRFERGDDDERELTAIAVRILLSEASQ